MTPFRIVPWHEDFLEACRLLADELTGGHPGRAVIVFPHSRPRRYLTDQYRRLCREQGRALLLPRMMTGEELRDQFRSAWDNGARPVRRAHRLDQVALLHQCVTRVALNQPADSPLRGLTGNGSEDMARFFPWGTRLADLMEECLTQMVDAADLQYAEGEVAPFAAALLAELRAIRTGYIQTLGAAGLSTPGLDAHTVARLAALPDDRRPALPAFLRGKAVILAGFVSLTRSEDALLRYLWKQGATVCLHTDPEVISGNGHWACAEHARWIRMWKARAERFAPRPRSGSEGPRLHFFAGYDLHSQLQELERVLRMQGTLVSAGADAGSDDPSDGSTPAAERAYSSAVVLPHASLLMPTLHHLPRKDINISLGYPLARSLLAGLLDIVFQARESLKPDGRHHWRPLLDLVRHPCLRMLRVLPSETTPPSDEPALITREGATLNQASPPSSAPAAVQNEGTALRPLLRLVENRLRRGGRLVDLPALIASVLDDSLGDLDGPGAALFPSGHDQAAGSLLERVMHTFVTSWNDVATLRGTAHRLLEMGELLLEHGASIWSRFPLDAECLFRLTQNLAPTLTDNAMADEPLPPETLFAIVRQALDEERVPFEADPLTGLQVLGMLETRLLRFDSVFLLDLTEDRLPGAPRHDPLLPDSLRGLLGLPDTGRRDMLAAHTFHRLLAGARDVWLFWQEGVESKGLLDAKKIRSRFVEKALWEEEKKRGRRLRPGEGPLASARFILPAPSVRTARSLPRGPAINARMEALLAEAISPTRLDAYLTCPARFFHEQLCGIAPLAEVEEGDDPAGAGQLLHRVLQRAFLPFVGAVMGEKELHELQRRLPALFAEEMASSELRENLPAESWLMLEEAGPRHLLRFARQQPAGGMLLQTEQEYRAGITVHDHRRELRGVLDRVDHRGDADIILDYKTGRRKKAPDLSFWQNDALWDAMESWTPPDPDDAARPDLLLEVADVLPSIQLPCYLYLWSQQAESLPGDAAWIWLGEDGKEAPLIGSDPDDQERQHILAERIPALLRFLLDHMERSPVFPARPGRHCTWCPCAALCR